MVKVVSLSQVKKLSTSKSARAISLETLIKVLGNGLKYIFPEEEISFWNYHSSGLQIHSPYIKNLTK